MTTGNTLQFRSINRILKTCVRMSLIIFTLTSLSTMTLAQAPAMRPDRGTGPLGSYAISDFENISLTTGNLNLSIPLAALPPAAGGEVSWTVRAEYSSKLWDGVTTPEPATESHGPYTANTLQLSEVGGWRLGSSYIISRHNVSEDFTFDPPVDSSDPEWFLTGYQWKMVLTTPDGAKHELRPIDYPSYPGVLDFRRGYYKDTPDSVNASMRYYSFDGSYLWAKIDPGDSWSVYFPDGMKVTENNGVQTITDPNGNSIYIYTTVSGNVTTTHYNDGNSGREITYTYNPSTNAGQLQYPTVGGSLVSIDVNYGTTLVQQTYLLDPFCSIDIPLEIAIPVIRSIVLPSTKPGAPHRQFTFSYNSDINDNINQTRFIDCSFHTTNVPPPSHGWGSLSQMDTPAGASVSYSYELDGVHESNFDPQRVPREIVTQKTVTHDGITDPWTYSNDAFSIGSVTAPDGSVTTETYYNSDPGYAGYWGGSLGKAGLVYRINSSDKVIIERHWTKLAFSGLNDGLPVGSAVTNPVMDAEYTTLKEGGALVKMSAKTFQYDYNSNVIQETDYDWFDPSLVSRDAQGVPTGVPAGAIVLRVINNSYYNQATTADSANVYAKRTLPGGAPLILNAPQQTTVGASITQYSYDNQAYGTPPSVGNLTRVSKWDDQAGAWRNTTYGYDSYGNKISITDPKNNVTNIAYDSATHSRPTQVTVDPGNGTGVQTTTTIYDYWTGLVTSQTDPNNQTTDTDYTNQFLGIPDPFMRPAIVTGPPVTSYVNGVTFANERHKTRMTYDDNLRQVTVESDLNTSGDYMLKSRITSDQMGRVVLTERNEDGAGSYTISNQRVYVQMGKITLASNPLRSATATTDGWTRTTNDELGRVIEVATFSGATRPPDTGTTSAWTGSVTTSYNANQVTVSDEASKKRRSETDALGRLIKVTEDPGGLNYDTTYLYDALGNLHKVTQGEQIRWFAYDSLSHLIRAKNPEQGTNSSLPPYTDPMTGGNGWSMAYTYDQNGNLFSKTGANDITTTYSYDALNRNKTVSYSDSTPTVTRTYDTAALGKGRLGKIETAGSMGTRVTINGYDAMGRPLSKSQQFFSSGAWGTSYVTLQAYDLAGNVTTLTYPSNRTVTYSYDQAGRLSDFSGNLGGGQTRTYSSNIQYHPAGMIKQEMFGTDTQVYHKQRYNNRLQLGDVRLSTGSDALSHDRGALLFYYGPNAVASTDPFANDPTNNGNLIAQANYVPLDVGDAVATDNYTYDALNRIASVTEPNVFSQTYDHGRYGNRHITGASGSVNNYNPVYDESTNRISGLGYDPAGNITSDIATGGTMTYDAENRMVTAMNAVTGRSGNYTYDAEGKRVRRITGGTETWYVYGIGGEFLAEYAANGTPSTPLKEYGYRGGELLIIAENGSGGGVSLVKPDSKSSSDLVAKNSSGASRAANRISSTHKPFAAFGHNKGYASIAADSSNIDNAGTLVRGGPSVSAEEYGHAPSANGVGGESRGAPSPVTAPRAPQKGYGRSGRSSVTVIPLSASVVRPTITRSPDSGHGSAPSGNGVGRELRAEHPAGAQPAAPEKKYGANRGLSIVTPQGVSVISPTFFLTPAPGLGGSAVSDASNTGHGNTNVLTGASGKNASHSLTKSCLWSSFQNVSAIKTRVTLKFDWAQSGSLDANTLDRNDSASASSSLSFGYSTAGSGWTSLGSVNHGTRTVVNGDSDHVPISDSGSVSVDLPNPGDIVISGIQVGDSITTSATTSSFVGDASATADVTVSISNIRVEVEMDTTAPVISNVASGTITASSATITWSTNESSDSQVEYGTSTSYGQTTALNSTPVTSHSQGLSNLAGGTTYHYQARSKDASGNLATSGDFTFTTPDVTPPVIFSVSAGSLTPSSATITWSTDENSDSQINYGTSTSYGQTTALDSRGVTAHSQVLSGLAAGTTYHYQVKSKDAALNSATSGDFSFTTPPDTTPPVISNVAAGGVTTTGATITWTTNENSDSQVDYGADQNYGQSTPLNTLPVTAHSQVLSGLATGTHYHYRVRSKDAASNLANSGDFTFNTSLPPVTNYSIWSPAATPGTPLQNDSSAVELGLKFRSDVNGFITGVRFYKGGAANGGTHVGHLWASDGTLLGSVTFANETASGWQQALFQNPIAITANTTYVVSYFAPQGNYAADNNYFASSGVDNALLHALSNAVAGGNGIFHYDAAGGFPADSFASTNYWVDVVFNDSASLPPRVLSVTPAAGATGVSIDVAPAAMFSKALDATSVGTSTVLLRDASNNPVSVTTSYAASTFTVTLTPQQPLQPGQTYTVTLKGGSAAPHITDSVGTPLASDYTWSFTTAPAAPPNGIYSIWSPAATPGTPLGSDGQAVELGLKFRSDISGFIAGVRFYKGGAANGGTHVGHLWASDGTLLSSVTFANETASGWQQALFQNPVPITANTTYVVSYFAPQGNYAGDNNYFATSGVDNAPLHALSNAASGGNGVYLYGATGGFPADTFSSLNYWVDVAFTLLDTAPPTVTAFSPAAGATNVNVNANITLTFSEAMDASTVSGSTLELRDPSNALIPATVSYNAASFTATLDPTSALSPGMTYTAHVRGGGADPRVKDLAGNALAADTTWTFTTAQTGGIKWLVTDHLGSTRMVVDQSGSLAGIERHDYLPFGEDLAGVGIRNSINGYGGDLVRQKFTGDERDDETKLDFAQSRYYSSIQGRFTRVDSFEPVLALKGLDLVGITAGPQAWNKYSYAYNNPLKYVDGNGKIGHILAGIAAGAIIGAGFEIFREWAKGEKLDPQKIGAAALGGGIAGGLAALTGGASLGSITLGVVENPLARLGIMTGANILGGMAERAADGDSATDALDPDSLVLDGITGVAGNFFGDWVAARYMKSAMYYAQLERLEEKLGIANRMANSGKTSKIRAKGRQMKAAIEAEKRATKESVVTFAFISALFGKSGGEFLKGASQAKGKEPGGEITGLCDQDGNNCAPIR